MTTTFFHFSDFHILPGKDMTREEGNPCNKIERIIDIAEETGIKPSFSLITGDISQEGSQTGYDIAKEYISRLESLGGPVIPVVGNVDRRRRFRENLLRGPASDAPCYHAETVDDTRIIVLDSQAPGEVTGALQGEQLDWLKGQLKHDTEPTIIAFHHPPFTLHLPNGGTHNVFEPRDAERLQQIVKHGNVAAVLCGHLHQSLTTRKGGVNYVVGPAALSESLLSTKESKTYDSSGFTIHTLHGDDLTTRPVIYSDGRSLIRTTPNEPDHRTT
jgi:Icc protein